jgi:hypothetical protein
MRVGREAVIVQAVDSCDRKVGSKAWISRRYVVRGGKHPEPTTNHDGFD